MLDGGSMASHVSGWVGVERGDGVGEVGRSVRRGKRGGQSRGWESEGAVVVLAVAPLSPVSAGLARTLVGVTQADQMGRGWVVSWVWWGAVKATRWAGTRRRRP